MLGRFILVALVAHGLTSLHADVGAHWPDWISSADSEMMNSEAVEKILHEIMGPLRPYSQDINRLVVAPGGAQVWQRGGLRFQKDHPGPFSFIAWHFNSYKVRNPDTDDRQAQSAEDWINVTPWPFGQSEVHDQIMRYFVDNNIKPTIQYFDPLGRMRNGGTVFQWVEPSSPNVVIRVCEIPNVQTTVLFFSEEDFRRVNFRLLERTLNVGEMPLL